MFALIRDVEVVVLYSQLLRPSRFRFRFHRFQNTAKLFFLRFVATKGGIKFDKDLRTFRIIINYFRFYLLFITQIQIIKQKFIIQINLKLNL